MNLIEQYLKEIEGTLAEQTVLRYKDELRAFKEWRRNRSQLFDKKNARDFLVSLQESGRGAAQIGKHKSSLSAFYSWLVENDHIESNTIRDLKFGTYRSPFKPDECTYTEVEYVKLKEHAKTMGIKFSEWPGLITVGWNTGLRLGDVARLAWAQVNLSSGKIDVIPSKTKRHNKRVEIPILPELREWLEAVPMECPYLFPASRAIYIEIYSEGLSKQFACICKGAGLKGKTFHGFRHTLTSRLLTKGVPLAMVSSITGHSLATLQRYLHVPFDEKARVVQEVMAA